MNALTSEIPLTIDELENHCFGCGTDNPQGLQLRFEITSSPQGTLMAKTVLRLTRTHQGAPGFVHGGIIATLMDEVMSKLNRPLGALAMTRHMEVSYLRPSPLGDLLTLSAQHLRREGRKLFHSASLVAEDGTLLAEAKGLFIALDPATVYARSAGQQF